THGKESMVRLGWPRGRRSFDLRQEGLDSTYDLHEHRTPKHRACMLRIDLHRTIDLVIAAARRARTDDPIRPRPERKRRDWPLAGHSRERRIVHVVRGNTLVKLTNVGVRLVVAGEGRTKRRDGPHPVWTPMCQLPREHSSQAPADQEYRLAIMN